MPESRFLDTAQVRVRFNAPFPSGLTYVGLVRFDGEDQADKHMQMTFDEAVNAFGWATGKIIFNGQGTRGLLSLGKKFEFLSGTTIKGQGVVINNDFELPKGVVFKSTGNLRGGGDPFE